MNKHQKTISFGVIFLAVIIPQIALAAWWNPLSWFNWRNIFHRKDAQIETLENRIKLLETQQNASTTTFPISTTTESTAPTSKPVAPKVINVPVIPKTTSALNTSASEKLIDSASIKILVSGFNTEILDYKKAIEGYPNFVKLVKNDLSEFPSNTAVQTAGQNVLSEGAKNTYLMEKIVETLQKMIDLLTQHLNSGVPLYQSSLTPLVTQFNAYNSDYGASTIELKRLLSISMQVQTAALDQKADSLKEQIDSYSNQTNNTTVSNSNQLQINALSLQIANLNAQYTEDIRAIDANNAGKGIPSSITQAQKQAVYNEYINNYNALMAQIQQLQYGN